MAKKGVKFSEEHKRKIGLANKGKKKHYKDEKTKLKVLSNLRTDYWLGKKRSYEDIEKFRKSHLGKKLSDKQKKKIGEANRNEKHWNWQGGKSFEPYSVDWTNDLRESIRKRDNYVCQECGTHQDKLKGRFKKLDVHHIDYNKHNLDPENLISLCRKCHMEIHNNKIK